LLVPSRNHGGRHYDCKKFQAFLECRDRPVRKRVVQLPYVHVIGVDVGVAEVDNIFNLIF
jgi:hypothetical protein